MKRARTTIVWFRRDLRVADHPALSAAVARGPVICLFVVDPELLARRHHRAPVRARFLRAGLHALDDALRARGSRLVVRHGHPESCLPAVAREADADRVHVSREISPYGRARDGRVRDALAAAGVELSEFGGDLVAEPDAIPGPGTAGYRVFTPFFRAWQDVPLPARLPAPERITGPELTTHGLDALAGGPAPPPAGPDAARTRIVEFVRSGEVDRYSEARDDLAVDGTSHLSAYLRFGMCTGAQIGRAIGLPGTLAEGRAAFWRQIAWREFFHHVLAHNPVAARTAYQPRYRDMAWDDDANRLDAWVRGETGYPVVDAGMRQLAQTGWMHNRARMITASFLVKTLQIDWRIGERVFMEHLVDGDPASNNGGWQWVAGTGTDAAPYFRILNPTRQGSRFDPDGAYVRRYVPELARVPQRYIHEPWRMPPGEQTAAGCRIDVDYPSPIVDHHAQRDRVLARYRDAETR